MTDVQIRNAVATDIKTVMAMDHTSKSDYVWQFDLQQGDGQISATFREIRLPRAITLQYPRTIASLPDDWNHQGRMLVAHLEDLIIGYLRLTDLTFENSIWITDLLVAPRYRRQGLGKKLVQAAQLWAVEKQKNRIFMEMSARNSNAIRMAQKLGFEYCGFNDQYYSGNDVAIFFTRSISA